MVGIVVVGPGFAVVDGDGVVACCVFPVSPRRGGGHAFALLVDRGAFCDLRGGWGNGWAGLEMLLLLLKWRWSTGR